MNSNLDPWFTEATRELAELEREEELARTQRASDEFFRNLLPERQAADRSHHEDRRDECRRRDHQFAS